MNTLSSKKKKKVQETSRECPWPNTVLTYAQDIPQLENVTKATFAGDTAIQAVGKDVEEGTRHLQHSLNEINKWTKKWRIKLNETKSTHLNFKNRRISPVIVIVTHR